MQLHISTHKTSKDWSSLEHKRKWPLELGVWVSPVDRLWEIHTFEAFVSRIGSGIDFDKRWITRLRNKDDRGLKANQQVFQHSFRCQPIEILYKDSISQLYPIRARQRGRQRRTALISSLSWLPSASLLAYPCLLIIAIPLRQSLLSSSIVVEMIPAASTW